MKNGKDKYAYYISLITLILVFFCIGFYLFSILYPYDPLEIPKEPATIINKDKVVMAGEVLVIEIHQEKLLEAPAQIADSFIDGIVYNMPSRISNKPKGSISERAFIQVPSSLPEGEYFFKSTLIFKVNPFREITKTWRTEQFRVLSPAGK